MRISDWSSDVCSSDLERPRSPCLVDHERLYQLLGPHCREGLFASGIDTWSRRTDAGAVLPDRTRHHPNREQAVCGDRLRSHLTSNAYLMFGGFEPDRQSVVLGKSVLEMVVLGGCRIIKKKKK